MIQEQTNQHCGSWKRSKPGSLGVGIGQLELRGSGKNVDNQNKNKLRSAHITVQHNPLKASAIEMFTCLCGILGGRD